jgi:hypothetical protein
MGLLTVASEWERDVLFAGWVLLFVATLVLGVWYFLLRNHDFMHMRQPRLNVFIIFLVWILLCSSYVAEMWSTSVAVFVASRSVAVSHSPYSACLADHNSQCLSGVMALRDWSYGLVACLALWKTLQVLCSFETQRL